MAIAIIAAGLSGLVAGALLTLAIAGRRPADDAQLLGQVRQLRADLAALGSLYTAPPGPVPDTAPRAPVSRLSHPELAPRALAS